MVWMGRIMGIFNWKDTHTGNDKTKTGERIMMMINGNWWNFGRFLWDNYGVMEFGILGKKDG